MDEKVNRDEHRVSCETPIIRLNCSDAFADMVPRERLYAYYISRAAYEGGLCVFLQVSPESAGIFCTLHRLFSSEHLDQLKQKAVQAGFSEEEWTNFLVWAAAFYHNNGNYKAYGDSKFIPDVEQSKLTSLMESSTAAASLPQFIPTYNAVADAIFALTASSTHLGFPGLGVTTALSENICNKDVTLFENFLKYKNLEGTNTRLFKDDDETLRIKIPAADDGVFEVSCKEEMFNGVRILVEKGDFHKLLERVCKHLKKAGEYEDEDATHRDRLQKEVLNKLALHFRQGTRETHKSACEKWIRDLSPCVESYLGFTYATDNREEFQGFVAAVNKVRSQRYTDVIERAEQLVKRLPWGSDYEKADFHPPDFTALDILAYAGSGIPGGVTLPKYDIRWTQGSKTFTFCNFVAAEQMQKQKMHFISLGDKILVEKFYSHAFEVQVGLHELLGHGSGKMFQRDQHEIFNFDRDSVVDLITGKRVRSWYGPGETWRSKLKEIAGAFEECRAEAVGYVLSCDHDILNLFGVYGDADEVKYVNWLTLLLGGLRALEHYFPDREQWEQDLCWARYVLLKVCLEAGKGLLTIEEREKGWDGKPDLSVRLDRSKIDSVGKPAVNEFLRKLQAYKSTGDYDGGKMLFDRYDTVGEQELRWRDICVAKKEDRPLAVQPNIRITGGEAQQKALLVLYETSELVTYPETAEGIIQSFVDRYDSAVIDDLESLWREDQKYFPSVFGDE